MGVEGSQVCWLANRTHRPLATGRICLSVIAAPPSASLCSHTVQGAYWANPLSYFFRGVWPAHAAAPAASLAERPGCQQRAP